MEPACRYEHRRTGRDAKLTEKQKNSDPQKARVSSKETCEDTILWVYFYTEHW